MNQVKVTLALLICWFFSFPTWAGQAGNGGGSWVCRENDKSIRWIELVDLFEAQKEFGLSLASYPNKSVKEILLIMKDRILNPNPARGNRPNLWPYVDILNGLTPNPPQITYTDSTLPIINDSFYNIVPPPSSCAGGNVNYEQVVNYGNDGKIPVQRQLFNKLSLVSKAALVVHEGVYAYLRSKGQVNSIDTRRLVGDAFSTEPDYMVDSEWLDVLQNYLPKPNFPSTCPVPSPEVIKLFSMIEDTTIPATDIQSFLQAHSIEMSVINDKCKTTFDVAIDLGRQDVLDVFFKFYVPDLSAPQEKCANPVPNPPSPCEDSIYSYGLAHGSLQILQWIKNAAASTGQHLSVGPVSGRWHEYYPQKYVEGTTDLMIASRSNSSVGVIQHLIQNGSPVNRAIEIYGNTALMYAATSNSSSDVIQLLIQAGANVSASTWDGLTSLMMAAKSNSNLKVTEALIKAGANVNLATPVGAPVDSLVTPLMMAAQSNPNPAVVRALLEAGAKVDVLDDLGNTPLVYAVGGVYPSPKGNPDVTVTQALIQAGADVNYVNRDGGAAEGASTSILMNAAANNANAAVIKALISAGAKLNTLDSGGQTALMYAAMNNPNAAVTQTLIQAGANLNVVDHEGQTALLDAAKAAGYREESNASVVLALVQGGADVNTASSSYYNGSMTALMYVAMPMKMIGNLYEYEEPAQDQIVQAMIQKGVNLNAQNDNGDTALKIALKYRAPKTLIILLGGK